MKKCDICGNTKYVNRFVIAGICGAEEGPVYVCAHCLSKYGLNGALKQIVSKIKLGGR